MISVLEYGLKVLVPSSPNQTLLCAKRHFTLTVPLPMYKWVLGDFMPGGGGVLAVYMTGEGFDGASYCKPKNIHDPEILHPKNNWHQNFPPPKITRLKYHNTDLFNQTDFNT